MPRDRATYWAIACHANPPAINARPTSQIRGSTHQARNDSLLVGAVGLAADGVHDHEIWFVPDSGGDLVSLGVVTPGRVVAHDVPERVARALHEGSQLVLTREPLGGKPPDTAAGPVVAEARFTTI